VKETRGGFASPAAAAQPTQESPIPSDTEIREILVDRIDGRRQSVGIVVGLLGPGGRRVIEYGHLDTGDPRPINGDTIFEIGSVTKVFTSLLLGDMVQRGEVALDDPVAKYLPSGVTMPERNGCFITLLDVATHTSGLPRLPTNMTFWSPANPYAEYSVEKLYKYLSTYRLRRDIGAKYEYSNLGAGLLGHVLAQRAGMDYEALGLSRICEPLGMDSTRMTLTPGMKVRFATGHNRWMRPVKSWDHLALAGAGALRSTASDLLAFLAANLGYADSPLAPAMAAMLNVRRPKGQPEKEIALGWHAHLVNGKEIVWHNDGTGGYSSFTGFDPKTRIGVVVLSNARTSGGVDDIGVHLLDASVPMGVFRPMRVRLFSAAATIVAAVRYWIGLR
jgi:CubicO group peptidase (beta-lactamase class C family)